MAARAPAREKEIPLSVSIAGIQLLVPWLNKNIPRTIRSVIFIRGILSSSGKTFMLPQRSLLCPSFSLDGCSFARINHTIAVASATPENTERVHRQLYPNMGISMLLEVDKTSILPRAGAVR